MLGQSARKGVAESTNPTQPSINRDEVAQFTNAGALLLRIIIIVSCIMFMLRSLSITPAIIITIVPAIATVTAFNRIGNNHGYCVANTVATVFDLVLISATVFVTGGIHSEAFLLYLLEIVVYSLNVGPVSCAIMGIGAVGFYLSATYASWASIDGAGRVIAYRAGILVLSGCGVGLLAKAYLASSSVAEAEHQRTEKRNRWDRILAKIAREVNSGSDLQATLESIVDVGLDVLQAEAGMIVIRDKQGRYVSKACRNLPPSLCGSRLVQGHGAIGLAIQKRETVVISDYQNYDKALAKIKEKGITSTLAAPIVMGSDVIGGLSFGHTRPETSYTEEECEFLEILGRQLSVTIGNARLLEEARRRADYLSTINEISGSFASVLEPEALFEKIYREVCRIIPMEAFFVATYHPQKREIEMAFLIDDGKRCPPARFKLDDGPTSRVIMTGQPFVAHLEARDDLEGARWLGHKPDPTRSIIIVPMRVGPHVVGAISTQSYQPNAYGPEEIELLTTIAASAAIALENARLYQTARELSLTDYLTDLGNYRFFCNALEREIERARRSGSPLSLIMIDSDSLKYVNDRYGHAIGDMHLIHLAETMRSVSRKSDTLARYAGDEFMIILPNTRKEDAGIVAERLRARIENSPLSVDGSPVFTTVSIGVASFPEAGSTVDELVNAVDTALYKAKRQGKNRVVYT